MVRLKISSLFDSFYDTTVTFYALVNVKFANVHVCGKPLQFN